MLVWVSGCCVDVVEYLVVWGVEFVFGDFVDLVLVLCFCEDVEVVVYCVGVVGVWGLCECFLVVNVGFVESVVEVCMW